MPRLKLVNATQPRSGTASFKKIAEILKTGTWEFPNDGKYNGSGHGWALHSVGKNNRGEVMDNNYGRDGNLCDTCIHELALCEYNPVFGIDIDPALAHHRDADMVVECDGYRANIYEVS